MANKPQLLDRWGNPVRRAALKHEVAAATVGSVRSPITGYPGDGLTPERLATILRQADAGDPIRYLELAETVEERDPHYLGVIGTRRRSVSQIDITVEPGSESPEHERHAQMVRDWLKRDELSDELFDILDCIPKGYSFTEIVWDTSMGQWMPERLEHRDPRWFRFDRGDLRTPVMLDDQGQEQVLPSYHFIFSQIKAKSGLPLRAGLARVAMWGWLFKAYTQRDWAIFSQTYGQPLRVGKWGAGASESDKDTLFNAVANIAGDCAAIIPESMVIEFVETKNVGAASDLYEKRANWLDMQISKAVLGQTATTDAVTGGLGSGKEHREVQEDIERADARALSAILNRDLVVPWINLEFGPQKIYPRLKIARPEPEDLEALSSALQKLVPLGLRVKEAEIRDKFGLAEPEEKDRILGRVPASTPSANDESGFKRHRPILKRVEKPTRDDPGEVDRETQMALSAALNGSGPVDDLTDRLLDETAPGMRAMIGRLEAMLQAAGSLGEAREMFLAAYPQLGAAAFSEIFADALIAAEAGGRAETLDG